MPGSTINRIGKYEIQAELGEGAFGRVYRAYDPTVNRPVAIKVLTGEGKDLITRFRTEASAAGNLRHKNIVTIYEFGEHKGRPFIAMELLEGDDLSQVIANHKSLTLLDKMRIMSQAAEGLHCAHANGVLHRDVKPANIKLLADGTVKILDFGIARLTRDMESTRLTQQGDLIGTILYMAPEQFSGSEVDRLCDIFAYGAIYYELLTGKHPFASPDPRTAMFKITFEDPAPLRQLDPTIPEAVEQIVTRALQKDRELRYQSLRDLLIDAKPVLLDLERERANSLLVVARDLFARGELEAAEAKAVEVIDLDLGIREAHDIREAVQKQLQARILQPRIQSLLRTAEESLALKRFGDAVTNFEAALRLDRTNAGIRKQLESARELLERGKKVSLLMLDARIECDQGHLEKAAQKVAAALELDPEHRDCQRLRAQIEQEIETGRQRELRESALRQVEALLDAEQADAALEVLNQLGVDAVSENRIPALLERANTLRERIARAQRRAGHIALGRDLLAGRRFQEAAAMLSEIAGEFPEDVEITSLGENAAAGLRAEAIARVASRARELSGRDEYDQAIEGLQSALGQYEGDAGLTALLDDTVSARDQHNRELAIRAALDAAGAERASGRLAPAISAVDAALGQWPGEQRLVALRAELEAESERARRTREVGAVCEAARDAVRQGRPSDAVAQLTRALEQFPEETAIRELLVTAESAVAEQRKTRIQKTIAEVRRSVDQGDFDHALAALELALQTDPDAPELDELLARTRAREYEARLERAYNDAVSRCVRLRDEGSLAEALAATGEALANFPGDQRLAALQENIQRAQRIALGRDLLAAHRFQEALTSFSELAGEFPEDTEIPSLREAAAAGVRDGAIAQVTSRARELSARHEYDQAAEAVQSALARYRGDTGLTALLDETVSAREQHTREVAITAALDAATTERAAGRLAPAISGLDAALQQWPGEQRLVALRSELEAEAERQRRTQEIGAVCAAARDAIGHNQPSDAVVLLTQALDRFPEESALRELLVTAEAAVAEQRQLRIQSAIAEVRRYVAQGDFDHALTVLERAQQTDPDAAELRESLAKTSLERAYNDALSRCVRLRDEGSLSEALAAAHQALAEFPGDQQLDRLRKEISRAHRLGLGRDQLAGRRFEEALITLSELAGEFPGDAEIAPVRDSAAAEVRSEKIAQVRSLARELSARHEYDRAVEALQSALAQFAGDPELTALLNETVSAREQYNRELAITAALDAARRERASGRLAPAISAVEAALGQWPGEPRLVALQAELEAESEQQRRTQEIVAACSAARDAMRHNQPSDAVVHLTRALERFPDEPAIRELLVTAEAAVSEQRKFRIQKAIAETRRYVDHGDFDQGLALLERALQKDPDAAELHGLLAETRASQEKARLQRACDESLSRCLQLRDKGSLAEALDAAREALANFPGDQRLAKLQRDLEDEIEVRAAAAYLENVSQQLKRERSLPRREDLLRTALSRYPDEPFYRQQLELALEQSKSVEAIAGQARAAEQSGDYDRALEVWTHLRTVYSDYPDLEAHVRRVTAAGYEIRARRSRLLAEMAGAIDHDELGRAAELLTQAEAEFAGSGGAELAPLRTRLDSFSAANRLVDEGRRACAAHNYSEGVEKFREAARNVPHDPAKIGQIVADLVEQGLTAVFSDWRAAQLIWQAASQLDGNSPALAGLRDRIPEQRRAEEVNDALERSRKLEESNDLAAAEKALRSALATYSGNELLRRRLADVQAAIEEQKRLSRREQALRDVASAENEAKAANATRLRRIAKQLDRISRENPGEAEVQSRVDAVRQAIADISKPKPKPPGAAQPAPPSPLDAAVDGTSSPAPAEIRPSRRTPVIVAGAAAAAVILTLIAIPVFRSGSGAALSISSNVGGAEVLIGSKRCVTPQCDLKLPAGSYTLTARKDGYKPFSQSLTIAPGQRTLKTGIAFEALPQLLQVNTNFESGIVYLDGQRAGDLQGGQFTSSRIEPGSHTIRVTGGSSEFEAHFKSATGETPQLTAPITAKDVIATVITNLGGTGGLACNCDSQVITVDGSPMGVTSRNAVAPLQGLAEGARRVSIQGRSVVADIRPNPTVSVFLALDRDVGTLVVETGQENARVFVDNKPYARLTEHGLARIQVDVGEHSLRVEREGFQSPAAQKVEVLKGEQKKVSLPLIPIPQPVLELASALPGAEVKIDGRPVGEVNSSGYFRAEVAPGSHSVELSRSDYTPARFSARFAPGKVIRPARSAIAMSRVIAPPPVQPDPAQIEAREWERVRNSTAVTDIDLFIRNHPGGAHISEARNLIARIRQQEQQAAQESAARAADQNVWSAVDKNRKASLQDYVNRFANGSHAQEARTLIAQIDRREAEAAAAAAASQPPPPPKPAAQGPDAARVAADRDGVLAALRAYAAAFANLDTNALRAVWPSVPEATLDALRASEKITRTLTPLGDPSISGDSATVVCRSSTFQQVRRQPPMSKVTQVRVALSRRGDSWVIVKVE